MQRGVKERGNEFGESGQRRPTSDDELFGRNTIGSVAAYARWRAVGMKRNTPTFKGEIAERVRTREREGSAGRGFLKWVYSEFGEERGGERWGRVCDYDSSSVLVEPDILLFSY